MPSTKTAVPRQQYQDCKAAVRFLRAHANELGIDAKNIGTIGHSAGGHLAALLATSNGVAELEGDGGNSEFSSVIQAAVPMGGQTNFLSQRNREMSSSEKGRIWREFLGGSQDDVPKNLATSFSFGSPRSKRPARVVDQRRERFSQYTSRRDAKENG